MDQNSCFTADDEPAPLKPFGTGVANMKLQIEDLACKRASAPNGFWVRFDAKGCEEGWSRLGYAGENAYLLAPPTEFYVEFDATGTPICFVDCGERGGAYWAQLFGYDMDGESVTTPPQAEPEPAPAAESLTDITRRFCR